MMLQHMDGYVSRFCLQQREKLMETVLEQQDSKTAQKLLFEALVYARTIEGKDYAYQVAQTEPFYVTLFASIWVFMNHHDCRYGNRNAMADVLRRLKAEDRYVKAGTAAQKAVLVES